MSVITDLVAPSWAILIAEDRSQLALAAGMITDNGGVAHMVERSLRMREARGSIPCTSRSITILFANMVHTLGEKLLPYFWSYCTVQVSTVEQQQNSELIPSEWVKGDSTLRHPTSNHAQISRPRVVNQTWNPVSLELKDTEVRAYRTDPVQRLGTRTRELFKVVVRVSLMAPTTSSQAWEALVRDEGGSAAVEVKIGRVNAVSAQGTADLVTDNKRAQFGRYKGMKWKAYTSLVYASLNRKITASFKGLYPNLLDTNKESKTQGIDKVLLSIACTVCPSPTSGPLGGKLIVGNHPHVSTERLIVVEASVGITGSIFEKGRDTLVFRSGQVQPVNPNIIDMQIDKEDIQRAFNTSTLCCLGLIIIGCDTVSGNPNFMIDAVKSVTMLGKVSSINSSSYGGKADDLGIQWRNVVGQAMGTATGFFCVAGLSCTYDTASPLNLSLLHLQYLFSCGSILRNTAGPHCHRAYRLYKMIGIVICVKHRLTNDHTVIIYIVRITFRVYGNMKKKKVSGNCMLRFKTELMSVCPKVFLGHSLLPANCRMTIPARQGKLRTILCGQGDPALREPDQ
ncbi:hypothetical protein V6N12_044669 [Hibiscus sabdariffa]|uniref:Uncharacterized protein n=1 Tax=Hibiscus sabdariffa TaxID=183260 RepID=A0ABR2AXK7_9ROSI